MKYNNIPTLVYGKSNRNIYQVHDSDVYENLSTGKAGRLTPEDAKRLFTVPLMLNKMAMENENLIPFIKMLGLAYEGVDIP